ncbi:MAG: nucleoside triphosphate pyrophosphohydrolase [Synergistaceae bacterium]|nr:nucleoside triphosphate pyrophosphohydrolase [Synergistaceae bacterium]MBR0253051.1 nucleoside triphosphate pyrophosphohydrolase [Synergistaceae bacterium]
MKSDSHYFDEIVNIIERLRAPDGCPWDRKQTLETLRTPITEEAYELADAITKNNIDEIKEEAGDLLLQVVFVASLAKEKNYFDIQDVVRTICDKLIRRHPHVFGNVDAKDADEVLRNWEKIKAQERKEKHESTSILSGIPDGLPPLLKANRIQGKVAHVGFDWPKNETKPLFDKLDEEIQELKDASNENNPEHIEEELGDVLFMTVNLARRLKVDPDAALNKVCEKFKKRFEFMEKSAQAEGKNISDYTLDELDKFWDKAKLTEK